MIALDPNILARFLLRDDETQYQAAAVLLKKGSPLHHAADRAD